MSRSLGIGRVEGISEGPRILGVRRIAEVWEYSYLIRGISEVPHSIVNTATGGSVADAIAVKGIAAVAQMDLAWWKRGCQRSVRDHHAALFFAAESSQGSGDADLAS